MNNILDLDINNENNNYSNNDFKSQLSPIAMENDLIDNANYSDTELDKNALINCDFSEEIKTDKTSNDELGNNNCDFNTDDVLINFQDNHDESEKSNGGNITQEAEQTPFVIKEIEKCPKQNDTDNFIVKQSDSEHQSQSKKTKTSFQSKLKDQSNSDSKCDVCQKTVYPMEKVSMDSKLYHKNCFRCCVCQKMLSPTVVTKFKDNLFCKPHYIEKFRIRGKYDDIGIATPASDSAVTYQNDYKPVIQQTTYQFSNSSSSSSSSNNKKTDYPSSKFVGTKDLASRFQESPDDHSEDNIGRKQPIDIGSQRRVSDATKAWRENQQERQANFKRGNSNNNNSIDSDVNQVSKGSVKNLKALFEQRN